MAELQGLREFKRRLYDAVKRMDNAIGEGIYVVGNEIIGDAKKRAPKLEGYLRGSGYCTLPEKIGDEVVCEIGFGGPAKDYVVKQHEDTTLDHTVGDAKFLQKAKNSAAGSYTQRVASVAREAFRTGSKAKKSRIADNPNTGAKE